MAAVAQVKIEYPHEGATVIVQPGEPIPASLPEADVAELTKHGSIGSKGDFVQRQALEVAERVANRAAGEAAAAQAVAKEAKENVRRLQVGDGGTGVDRSG